MFKTVFISGVCLVLLQGLLAYFDGYLTQKQMARCGILYGYSFMEHAGMWADMLVINFLIAYLAAKYKFNYISLPSLIYLIIISVAWSLLTISYAKAGAIMPEAHVHNGHVTGAGWVHLIYAIGMTYFVVMFYFTPVAPHAYKFDVVLIAIMLTIFFPVGVYKISSHWKITSGMLWQVGIEVAATWLIAILKIVYFCKH